MRSVAAYALHLQALSHPQVGKEDCLVHRIEPLTTDIDVFLRLSTIAPTVAGIPCSTWTLAPIWHSIKCSARLFRSIQPLESSMESTTCRYFASLRQFERLLITTTCLRPSRSVLRGCFCLKLLKQHIVMLSTQEPEAKTLYAPLHPVY